jgi:hypothetical protein
MLHQPSPWKVCQTVDFILRFYLKPADALLLKICYHATLTNVLTVKSITSPSCCIDFLASRTCAGQGHRMPNAQYSGLTRMQESERQKQQSHTGTSTGLHLGSAGNRIYNVRRWVEFIIPASRKEKWPQDLSSEPPPISIYLLVLCRPPVPVIFRTLASTCRSHYIAFDGSLLSPPCERVRSLRPNRCMLFVPMKRRRVRSHRLRWMTDVVQRA